MAKMLSFARTRGRKGSRDLRRIIIEDQDGYKHVRLLRDDDPDDMAEFGVPLDPPDISLIAWEEVKRDLHNALVSHGLFTWQDVQRRQSAISTITRTLLKRRLVLLYRMEEQEVKRNG